MMSTKQKQIGAVVAVCMVLLLGTGVARAQSGFWDVLAKVAGQVLGERLAEQVSFDGLNDDEFAGASGDTFSLRRTGQKQLVYNSPTTSPAFVVLSSSLTTTIRDVSYFSTAASLVSPTTITFGIASSTACVAGNTAIDTTLLQAATFSSSTARQWFTTSTFTSAADRVVSPGSCVKATYAAAVTTTDGFLAVDHFIQQ